MLLKYLDDRVNYHWAKDPVASSEAQVHQTQPQKWEPRSSGQNTCGGPHQTAALLPGFKKG